MNDSQTAARCLREGTSLASPFTRVLALGYYDGPTDGVVTCGDGGEIYKFDLLDAIPGDVRVFALSPLPATAWKELLELLVPQQTPRWPSWCPIWEFSSPEVEARVEQGIEAVLGQAGPTKWVVETEDLLRNLLFAKRVADETEAWAVFTERQSEKKVRTQ